jgi:hypothetical protein
MYKLIGVAFLILGIYITKNQIATFKKGEQGQLGFNHGLLVMAIGAIIVGIIFILR